MIIDPEDPSPSTNTHSHQLSAVSNVVDKMLLSEASEALIIKTTQQGYRILLLHNGSRRLPRSIHEIDSRVLSGGLFLFFRTRFKRQFLAEAELLPVSSSITGKESNISNRIKKHSGALFEELTQLPVQPTPLLFEERGIGHIYLPCASKETLVQLIRYKFGHRLLDLTQSPLIHLLGKIQSKDIYLSKDLASLTALRITSESAG